MKIILLKNIDNLGKKGEIKEVAPGFAKNFLIPKKMAILATDGAIKMTEDMRKKEKIKKAKKSEEAGKLLKAVQEITIKAKTNKEGHLFAGVGTKEISQALSQITKSKIDPNLIQLDKKIKAIGDYKVEIKIGEKRGELKLKVEKE